jgi:hypothetical protein
MRFSLIFENNAEGYGSSYDLIFAPCPCWVQGNYEILNMNPESPELLPGSVNRLIEKEKLGFVKKCIVIVHSVGQGDEKSLKQLMRDLDDLDILFKIVDFNF